MRLRSVPYLSLALGCAPALSACNVGEPADQIRWERVIGFIFAAPSGAPVIADVPATARAGMPFTVTVNTFGSSTCVRQDGASVAIQGSLAEIIPYDRVPRLGSGAPCTADFSAHPRPVSLQFTTVGPATIRVIGRSVAGTGMEVLDTVEAGASILP